jgi:tetratricopeptide (TPR) repeat protein
VTPAALLALAVALAAPRGTAAPAATPAAPPPVQAPNPVSFEASLLFPADELIKRGDLAGAADALMPLVERQDATGAEALARFGRILDDWDKDHAALLAFSKAFKLAGSLSYPLTDRVDALKRSLDLAEKTGDVWDIAAAMAKNPGLIAIEEHRPRLALILGRYHARNADWGNALGMLALIPAGAPQQADGESLRGIALAQQGKFTDAIAPLVTARELGVRKKLGGRFEDVQNLNLGRVYYGAGNWNQAAAHLTKVNRGSELWPEAQFERAWAHFRGDDYAGAMGVLETHDSPFFADFYVPEAQLLRAFSLFQLCMFGEVNKEIEEFEQRYQPILDALDRDLSGLSAVDAFAVRQDGSTAAAKIPAPLRRLFDADERLGAAERALPEIAREITELGGTGRPAGAMAKGWLEGHTKHIRESEGKRVLERLTSAQVDLRDMLQSLKLTRIDVLNLEARLYGRAAQNGTPLPTPASNDRRRRPERKVRRPERTKLVWPFEGEFWADELGWYRMVGKADCSADLGRDVGAGR